MWLMPLAVLLLSITATLVAVLYVALSNETAAREHFRSASTELNSDIHIRLETYIATLRAGAALFGSSDQVSGAEFTRFAGTLQLQRRYPGIQGLGFSVRLRPHEVPAWVERMRTEGQPEFHIWPDYPRDEYHSISFLEPLDRRNAAAIGYDMFTEPVRRAAMTRACDTGNPAATGKVTLVQEIDIDKQSGVLIYVPVYRGGAAPDTVAQRRQQLVGFVYAPFRAGDLLSGIFDQSPNRVVTFRVFDTHRPSVNNLLFEGPGIPQRPQGMGTFRSLEIAGRPWTIQLLPTDRFHSGTGRTLVWYVAATGTLGTLALFFMSRAQVRARELAETRAEQIGASESALRRSESRFRRIYDSNVVGLGFSHTDGRILDANEAACRIFGISRDDVLAGTVRWDALTVPQYADRDRDAAEQCRLRGVCAPYEKELFHADGSRVLVLVAAATLGEFGDELVYVVLDLTERKRAEDAMRLAREAAETSNRLKDEFLATVSHELRTPLNAMLGWTQLLRAAPARDPVELQRALETIERNARAQAQLIDDLLDVSRIISGKMRIQVQPADAAPVVDAAVASAEPAATAKGVRLVRDYDASPARVLADPTRLQQIAWNLISNAIKFTPRGGSVAISVAQVNDHVQLTVRDTGIGIDPAFLPHVFERFTQADPSPTRRHGGLGLGLGIVRHLVEMHGGTVDAYSDGRDHGATFRVCLPAVDASTPPREIKQVFTPPLHAAPRSCLLDEARILVIDDEADALDLLAQILQAHGAAIATASTVDEAIAKVETFAPELIISDLAMPDVDGYDFLRRLRQRSSEVDRPTPVVALTAYARREDRERALRAGFQFHLPKPVQPDELVRVAAALLGRECPG